MKRCNCWVHRQLRGEGDFRPGGLVAEPQTATMEAGEMVVPAAPLDSGDEEGEPDGAGDDR